MGESSKTDRTVRKIQNNISNTFIFGMNFILAVYNENLLHFLENIFIQNYSVVRNLPFKFAKKNYSNMVAPSESINIKNLCFT